MAARRLGDAPGGGCDLGVDVADERPCGPAGQKRRPQGLQLLAELGALEGVVTTREEQQRHRRTASNRSDRTTAAEFGR
jgi:hypothetical protein